MKAAVKGTPLRRQ